MTVNQALVLTMIIAIITSITGADIVNNTTFLILLIIALVALARTSFNYTCANTLNNNSTIII